LATNSVLRWPVFPSRLPFCLPERLDMGGLCGGGRCLLSINITLGGEGAASLVAGGFCVLFVV